MSASVLTTNRLTLRPFSPQDAEDFHRNIMADAEVMRFLHGVKTLEETQILLKNRFRTPSENEPGAWAITLKDDPTGEVVGHVGFLEQELDGQPVEEMSYRLASRLWGKGLATEAAIGARDWFFQHTKLGAFVGFILPENASSIATAEQIGMTYWKEAVVKRFEVRAYRLTREEWARLGS